MSSLSSAARAQASKPGVQKLIKYSLVSIIAVVITMGVQVFCYGVLRISGGWSAIIASTIAAVPSYYLNRSWVWGKNGRSHIAREVVPFWVMVFIGLAASAGASALADSFAQGSTESHATRTLIVAGASFASFAALWLLKFLIFNKILFAHHPEKLDPAFDGRAGVPT